jgi:predicted metal-dependent peptidase
MSADNEARARVVKSRSLLLLDHPFFGSLSLSMTLKEDPDCQTAWSDGSSLAYNPSYVGHLSRDELKGLVGHLVMHQVCKHHLRRGDRDPAQWNAACDHAINWILLDAGLTLPDGYLDNPEWRGKTADEIYDLLSVREDPREGGREEQVTNRDNGNEEKADSEETGSEDQASSRNEETDDGSPVPSKMDSVNDPKENPRCKDGNGGDPGNFGEVRDAPDPGGHSGTTEDAETRENEWKISLAQAAMQAKSMGDLPGALARLIDNILSPKLDWRSLLGRFINATARNDYALMPPNRRYLHRRLFLPSMRSEDLPEAVVAVDTSGSVSQAELEQFTAELTAIISDCAMEIHLLFCDAKVTEARKIHRMDLPVKLDYKGGGGTDFRPAFRWVEEQGLQPRYMIYLTDLACNRFPEPPLYPVLWARTGPEDVKPPFGDVIEIR